MIFDCTGSSWEFPMEIIEYGNLIGSINGTIVGGAELVMGRKGLALNTNGVDQYVDFGYQGDTCLVYFAVCTRGWATAFWVRLGNSDNNEEIIMDTGAAPNKGVGIAVMGNQFNVYLRGDNKGWSVHGVLTEQIWAHVIVTWRLCYGAKLYIDGKLVSADTHPSNQAGPLTEETCFVLAGGCRYTRWFEGALDEFHVWDTVMNDEEVMALYTVNAGLSQSVSY